MNDKLTEALNFLNTLSKEDIKTQFEKSFKKFEDVKYDENFFRSMNYYDEFLIDLKTNCLYNDENDILSNLDEYSIAA
ncbi:hypothetical protein [Fusobacterium polymorphum]|uniref:Uncharacterized protein n=1 Tax=Fusobacterium nucleatum subsp. polymorphum TaxID=76857 RepID=A0A2C6BR41_FUSNP|nr:hypothetical protein [Fusobacterium polymorphum]PHI08996.1 hypothetical protein CA845_02460 [Fusobacterium polymorphum]PHI12488.1 hypothetical protein CBG59_01130 [Fusobacterium polymorphum]